MLRLAWFMVPTLVALGVVVIVATAADLPAIVASKFGADGAAIGRMSREGYVALMAGLTVFMPVAFLVFGAWLPTRLGSAIRVGRQTVAPRFVVPARRVMQSYMLAMAATTVVFMVAMHLLIVQAHRHLPPRLAEVPFYVLVGAFVLVLLAGGLILRRQLRTYVG